MELSEEFILELTQVQQRLSAFCSSDWPIANKPVRFCNEPISCFAGSPRPGTNFKDWAMTVANYEVMAYRKKSGVRPLALQDRSRLHLFKLCQRTTTTTNHIQT